MNIKICAGNKIMNIDNLEKSVYYTLKYFYLFHYPLNFEKLKIYLLKNQKKENLKNEKQLQKFNFLYKKNDKYFLKDKEYENNIKEYETEIQNTLEKVKKYFWIFRFIPYIKSVFICNNFGFGIKRKNSDIDLFIITQKNRIWISRLITTFIFHILQIRRHKNKIKNRFCLSFYATEDNLDFTNIFIKPFDIYFIYWIISLYEVYSDKKSFYEKIINANNIYLTKYVNLLQYKLEKQNKIKGKNIILLVFKINLIGNMLNFISKKIQLYFINKSLKKIENLSGILINDNILKFHEKDKRKLYYNLTFQKCVM